MRATEAKEETISNFYGSSFSCTLPIGRLYYVYGK